MTTQAGWYPDPSGDPAKLRYWNGEKWTDDFADAQPASYQGQGYSTSGYAQPAASPTYYPPTAGSETERTLRLIAFILCIFSTVSIGWLIVPLLWMVPMSVMCWGIYQGTRPNTVAFGVCTLIFLNFFAGILLLISKKDA